MSDDASGFGWRFLVTRPIDYLNDIVVLPDDAEWRKVAAGRTEQIGRRKKFYCREDLDWSDGGHSRGLRNFEHSRRPSFSGMSDLFSETLQSLKRTQCPWSSLWDYSLTAEIARRSKITPTLSWV